MATSASRREFAALLDDARRERHLSIRAAARVADVPAATVQGWLNGRHFPVAALRPNYLRLVDALGLSGQVPADLWSEVQPQLRIGPAPYLGLRPFAAADRDYFFGRGRESRRLAEAIQQQRNDHGSGIIVVLGASGTGKSSLLAAGLIGTESVDGTLAGWSVEGLSATELSTADDRHADLVVIDQFEEVFTLEPERRTAAIAVLSERAQHGVVVIAMRADAFGHASLEPTLLPALEQPFLVSPMTREEARQVIVGPAGLADVVVDEALVPVLLDDLAPGPSEGLISPDILPLLSNSLLVTWAAGRGSRVSLQDYLGSGGVARALQTLAEEVFTSLEPAQQQAAQSLFLRLVRFSGDAVSRESVPLSDIDSTGQTAMDAFVAARMLTVGDGVVRMSHEALMHHWPRLGEWINEAKADLAVVDQLRAATRVWNESGRTTDALIPVERIEVFSQWVSNPRSARMLGVIENEFIEASQSHFASQLAREQAISARLRRGRSTAIMLTALISLLGLVVASLYVQGRGLQAQTDAARLESQSRQFALDAQYVRADDPNQMAQMALAAADIAQTRQSLSTLIHATSVNVPIRWQGSGGAVLAQSPDSSLVARANGKGDVTLWRADDLVKMPGSTFQADPSRSALFAVALTQVGGRTLMAVGGAAVAQLWDVTAEPRLVHDLWDATGAVKGMSFDAAGRTLAVGTTSGVIALWELPVGDDVPRRVHTLTLNKPADPEKAQVWAVALSPSGTSLFVGGRLNAIARWSLAGSPRRLPDLRYEYNNNAVRVQALAVSPEGDQLAAGLQGRRVLRWQLSGEHAIAQPQIGVEGWTNAISYSADGGMLLVANSSQNVYLFDPVTGSRKGRLFDAHNVTGAQWVRNRVVSVEDDGGLRVWQERTIAVPTGSIVYGLAADDHDQFLAATTLSDDVHLWRRHDQTLEPLAKPDVAGRKVSSALAFAPNGRFLIGGTTAANNGQLISWPMSTEGAGVPRFLQAFGKEREVGMAAVSFDSTLVAATEYVGQHVALFRASPTGELTKLATMDAPLPQAIAFSADARILAVPLAEEKTQLWDIADPQRPVLTGTVPNPGAPASAVAFSPKGHMLAVGSGSGEVSIWDVENPAAPAKLRSYRDAVAWINMIRFSPDGLMLAASGGDKYVWVWQVDDQAETAQLALATGSPRSWDLRFLNGGSELIVGGDSAEVRSWLVRPDEAKAMLCAHRGDPLSADEWARYLSGVPMKDPC